MPITQFLLRASLLILCVKTRFGEDTLPHRPGVYLVLGRLGKILYVGQAVNLNRRHDRHEKNTRFAQHGARSLWALTCDRRSLDPLEHALVVAFKPPLNSQLKSKPLSFCGRVKLWALTLYPIAYVSQFVALLYLVFVIVHGVQFDLQSAR